MQEKGKMVKACATSKETGSADVASAFQPYRLATLGFHV